MKFKVTVSFEIEEDPKSFKDNPDDAEESTPEGDDLINMVRQSVYDNILDHIDGDDVVIEVVTEPEEQK